MAHDPYDIGDAILPEGFDPSNENYSLDDEVQTEEAAPTTEQAPESEQTPDTSEETQSVETDVATEEPTLAPEVQQVPQTIKVRFNHEDRELSLDEATVLAQKGMNYDKLNEKMRDFETRDARSALLAKRLGYDSADEMLAAAEQNLIQRKIRELEEAGNTTAMAKFLVEQEMKAQTPELKAQPQPTAPATQQLQKPELSPERRAEFQEFFNAYPGVTKLPDEVLTSNRNGVRLKAAYEMYLNKQELAQKSKELAILKQNQAAAAKAPVTGATGKASADTKDDANDPFMRGLLSDDY